MKSELFLYCDSNGSFPAADKRYLKYVLARIEHLVYKIILLLSIVCYQHSWIFKSKSILAALGSAWGEGVLRANLHSLWQKKLAAVLNENTQMAGI